MKRYPLGWRLPLLAIQVAGGLVTAHIYDLLTIGSRYA